MIKLTHGTAKVYRNGKSLAIIIGQNIVKEEKLESGCTIEIDVKKLGISVEGPKHGEHLKKEVKNETQTSTIEQPSVCRV